MGCRMAKSKFAFCVYLQCSNFGLSHLPLHHCRYWLVKNSWGKFFLWKSHTKTFLGNQKLIRTFNFNLGETWGEKGFGKIIRGKNLFHIEECGYYPVLAGVD